MKRQALKYSFNTGLAIVFVLGIVVLVEAISYRHHKRFDLTSSKQHTLSDQTKKIISSLQKEIKVTGFFNQTQVAEEEMLRNLLDMYVYHSSKFSYEFIDPDKNPGKAKRYQITTYGTSVVESGDKEEKVLEGKEEKITNAILKVTREGEKIIYFSKGHGEKNIEDLNEQGYSFAKKTIEESNYKVKELFLATDESLPEDANLLIIPGPQKPILKAELETVEKYIKDGGKVFFMVDPGDLSELTEFVKDFGISLQKDLVVDKVSRIFGLDPSMPVITQYGEHPIVRNFSIATFFPLTRSVEMTTDSPKGINVASLVNTSPNSWAETDLERYEKGEVVYEEGKDRAGPISIGVVASLDKNLENTDLSLQPMELKQNQTEENIKTEEGRIVVIGDSDFASNARINILGNSDFFLNVINWLLEEEDLISIRPKESTAKTFTLTEVQQKMIFWVPLVFMPGLFILSGIMVYKKRKNMK